MLSSGTNSISPIDDDNLPISSETVKEDHAVGLTDGELSRGRRQLLDLMNRIFNTGVQADINIPQIAVIGSQSAGKSSLIESISGITLPRAAGTCTRCPTECKLSHSAENWKCIISLRFTTDLHGQTLGQPRTIAFGPPITNKGRVEERIRRAQRAILNPSTAPQHFLDGDDEDLPKSELTFSTNCVSLQISGPGIADLSFCDLPGLIASVGSGGNATDIKLVESLVISYISKPSCVILLTVTCETDFENQGAHHLAKTYDPQGERTIGVLTKPDRIPSGEEARWVSILKNELEPLDNNWFCVKQPGSNDMKNGITWDEARKGENDFFSMTAPWRDLDPLYQKYLRTTNLIERASQILSNLISERLPKIQDELQIALRQTEENLRKLPKEPSSDSFSEIMTMLHQFSQDLSRHVDGIPDEDGLLQKINLSAETFRKAIRKTVPNFVLHDHDSPQKSPKVLQFLLDEEGDEYTVGSTTVHIAEVMQRAERARTRELPGNYPFLVKSGYVSAITDQWKVPAASLCKAVFNVLCADMKQITSTHFAGVGQGHLEQRVQVVIRDHLQKHYDGTMSKIDWLIDLERNPFTLNTHYFNSYKNKFLAHYKGSRVREQRPQLMEAIRKHSSDVTSIVSSMTQIGVPIKAGDIPRLLPPDDMEPALTIMAEVRAYFQVAYKRFVDNIPLAIDYELVHSLKRDILPTLYAGLGISGPDGMKICQELMQESPKISERRAELRKKWERLDAASHELLQIRI